jgi:hypothetical protein
MHDTEEVRCPMKKFKEAGTLIETTIPDQTSTQTKRV